MKLSLLIQNLLHFVSVGSKDWGGLHPSIIHFPIALLTVTPLFIFLGLIFKKSSQTFYQAALLLMILGTAGLFLAYSTGSKAADAVEFTKEIFPTLKNHMLLAEQTRTIFSVLTGFFLIFISFFPLIQKKCNQSLITGFIILYLLIFSCSILFLLNTAHYGGELVHHLGIKSTLYSK